MKLYDSMKTFGSLRNGPLPRLSGMATDGSKAVTNEVKSAIATEGNLDEVQVFDDDANPGMSVGFVPNPAGGSALVITNSGTVDGTEYKSEVGFPVDMSNTDPSELTLDAVAGQAETVDINKRDDGSVGLRVDYQDFYLISGGKLHETGSDYQIAAAENQESEGMSLEEVRTLKEEMKALMAGLSDSSVSAADAVFSPSTVAGLQAEHGSALPISSLQDERVKGVVGYLVSGYESPWDPSFEGWKDTTPPPSAEMPYYDPVRRFELEGETRQTLVFSSGEGVALQTERGGVQETIALVVGEERFGLYESGVYHRSTELTPADLLPGLAEANARTQ